MSAKDLAGEIKSRDLQWVCFIIKSLKALTMIRKLSSGQYRLYSRKKDARTGKRRNLGTFATREKAEAHERAVQFFKRH